MAALSSLQHRNGMIYHDQEDSSSGEFSDPNHHHHHHHHPGPGPVGSPGDMSAPQARCNSRSAGSEASYEEIYSSSEEESYHSDCGDIAEYWDPYCEQNPAAKPCMQWLDRQGRILGSIL